MTSAKNPWSEIYNLAAWRRKQTSPLSTLSERDVKLTTNLEETLQYMIQTLTPEDKQDDENATQTVTRNNVRNNRHK